MRMKEVALGVGASVAGIVFMMNADSTRPISHLLFLAGTIMIVFGIVRIVRANIPES